MKKIHPDFEDKVSFIPVDIGNSTDFGELNEFAAKNQYPWVMGKANRSTLEILEVTTRSSKIAINANGTIVYRAGMSQGTDQEWTSVFRQLSDF
jgi:Tfp pilus assembly PilM family ATPase|tara:strand:+ start:235 stop:516 length:282 start_codon:yes stop_codon:yes gene_type:complete